MKSVPPLRTLLVLGRVAGLPVIWADGLAGWWLGGGSNYWKLPFLLLGLTALQTGGMFLHDAFDADSDQRGHAKRPIPAGKIPAPTVWRYGFSLLAIGLLLVLFCGQVAALGAVFLIISMLLFNFTHRWLTASPWLLGICHFWVYVIAGATGVNGLNGGVIFCGTALALYVAGAGHVTRHSLARRPIPLWATLLLVAPVVMAALLNTGSFLRAAIGFSILLLLWLGYCLRKALFPGEVNAKWAAANLFAGIVLVDWLAIGPIMTFGWGLVGFGSLLGTTQWLRRHAPAA
jgi:hypothetical protein